jgi:hypothetical protein
MKKSVLTGILLIIMSHIVYGQGCAMCTKVAAGLDSKSAKGLNGGIIYLAFLPLVIMGTLGIVWYRHHKGDIIASNNRDSE